MMRFVRKHPFIVFFLAEAIICLALGFLLAAQNGIN
jgi:hypothetical protein